MTTALVRRHPAELALLGPIGSFDAYVDAVSRIPVLSREDEHELATRYRRDDDLDAARQLVLSHLRFAGGAGVVVGNSVMASPSVAEMARALEAARNDVSSELTRGGNHAAGPAGGETRLRRTIEAHRAEFALSSGRVWLTMVTEDFGRSVSLRRRALQLGAEIEARQAAFAANGDALAAQIRENVETPAWRDFTAAAAGAQRAVEDTEHTIRSATFKAVLLTLLALVATRGRSPGPCAA